MSKSNKKTVIMGASPNPSRYAYLAAQRLHDARHDFIPLSIKKGEVFGTPFLDLRKMPRLENVDTITLYLNPTNQAPWVDYMLSLKPKRIIFNPGTENIDFAKQAQNQGLETVFYVR